MATQTPREVASTFKKSIREFEAKFKIEPANIEFNEKTKTVSISFRKHVLYQYQSSEGFLDQLFTMFSADKDLDCAEHQKKIKEEVLSKSNNTISANLTIDVKKQFKLLPIPYFDIPMKVPGTHFGWRRSGTCIRDYSDLAVQPAIVKLTFATSDIQKLSNQEFPEKGDEEEKQWKKDFPEKEKWEKKLWELVERAACLPQNGERSNLPYATKRVSQNPIKWLLMLFLIPVPKFVSDPLPNRIKKVARPYPHGYQYADYHIDTPYINSGFLASVLNMFLSVITILVIIVLVGTVICAPLLEKRLPKIKSDNKSVSNEKEKLLPLKQRYSLFFAQTRAKITNDDNSHSGNEFLKSYIIPPNCSPA